MKKFISPLTWLVFGLLASMTFTACEQVNLEDCFAPINGTWVRVESSNPSNDCLKIVISGEVGVVFDNPKNVSWLDEGDYLWREITHVERFTSYELRVLGSDGNYYEATLELEGTNTLNLTIDASGAGATQKWIRVDADEVVGDCKTSDLNGNWTRVQSNNSSNDGMRMRIENEEGILTFVPTSSQSYSVGDLVWRDIQATADLNQFTCEVLGSDNNYYPATIEVQDDNVIELTIGSSGSGNIQTWER